MKKLKIIIDIIMFITIILLMNMKITGLQLHEIMGIGIFIVFIIHKILNFKWIKSISKNFTNKKLQKKSKTLYILDIILFLFVTADVFTGILISKCILTQITIKDVNLTTILHKFFSIWSLILISIHIGFHWKTFVNYLTAKFKILQDNIFIKIAFKIVYIGIAILGITALLKKDIYKTLLPIKKEEKNQKENFREIDKNINEKDFPKNQYERKNKNKKQKDENATNNKENNLEKENVQTTALVENSTSGGTPTLNEFLSKLNCSGCGKRCVLTNPQCNKGMSYQQQKIQEYNELYGSESIENSEEKETDINNSKENIKDNNINEIAKANIEGISVIDYISIMGLFVGGTYYTLELIENKKNIKTESKSNSLSN